ncbi:FAD-binding oxidoreductase [Mesorhizobium sp. YC-39]|uniref:FAD-binding oxidoreductase n=1 Tax=unclassified Mesorhizobium TaxID=325217 RepID=UPI0021E81457|nr:MULTISPECIES: FAD-binding oxidoreductase [unclassified Mesorhizobium]MCV3210840.1 FAD-binding oxidoreductase [Mesorhizobium sp. YC-2]MCV3231074.1 FAD-binding oxidoreductase [Mesorhizobium sp. YC-39]
MTDQTDIISLFSDIVGARNVVSQPSEMEGFLTDVRRSYRAEALCVVLPADTNEVSDVMKLCHERGIAVTPMGGNTGLVGGAIARTEAPGIILSLKRMNRVRELSLVDDTITVDAGCVLADIQRIAADADRLFPLSLSSEGSCQIGGNIATNAGGVTAVRYGTMRQLVLGLEVVLPNGTVLNGLLKLRKDNTGYDLRQLFIGAEGTLGVITAAVLKLFPAPKATATAMLSVSSVDLAMEVLGLVRSAFGERLTSFEIISADYMDVVLRNVAGTRSPFADMPAWNLLVEIADSNGDADLATPMEAVLKKALERELIADAVIAQSEAQAASLWHLRHAVSDAIRYAGPNMSHDSSVPLDKQGIFADLTGARISARFPESEVLMVGHLGDGNMHIVVLFKPDRFAGREDYMAASETIDLIIDEVVVELKGSITAEHGVGLSYRHRLDRTTEPAEIELMRAIKNAFDPRGIMNPGKILLPSSR